ncbi:MAG: MurR/RpiR family transcriptional regulator [Hyphomicrobiales bacterium]
MKKAISPSFLQKTRNQLPNFHPTERRLADFLLNFPGEIASYTASELANLANVSNATVTRFIRKLGYANYDEARREVRAEQKTGAALLMVTSTETTPDENLRVQFEQAQQNLQKTVAGISSAEVDELASEIINAKKVWVIGFRTSHSFATYFHWQIFQVVDNISVLPRSGQTLAEHIAAMDKDHCVIFIGMPRRIRQSDTVLELIARTGAKIAYISDDAAERQKYFRWHFKCQTAAPGPLFGHVSVMAVIHFIATRVVQLGGTRARKRLSSIEMLHDALDEL